MLKADDDATRRSRLALCAAVLRVLTTGLGLLGVPLPTACRPRFKAAARAAQGCAGSSRSAGSVSRGSRIGAAERRSSSR